MDYLIKGHTFTNEDLYAAIRGARLRSLSRAELTAFRDRHEQSELYMSTVLAEAATQLLNARVFGELVLNEETQ